MRNLMVLFFALVYATSVIGQSTTTPNPSPSKANVYTASVGETIFSWGNVDAGDQDVQNVVRFSPVFNFGQQVHIDFSNNFGIYTGLNLRNVGLITHTNMSGYEVKIKERSYGLGLPLALKLGDFDKNFNLAVGGELEVMFAWKRKIFVGDDVKTKDYDWFSDEVNIFNPSLFAEIKFYKGQYIRFKYYLDDFLQYQQGGLIVPIPGVTSPENVLPDYAKASQLMYISIGAVVSDKKMEFTPDNSKAFKANDGYFRTASR